MPAFFWLRRQVEIHALNYARTLGANVAIMGFHFQRAWPVFSRTAEKVAPHTHPNANISAVYYLQVRDPEKSGHLVFLNEHEPNALGPDLSGNATAGIAGWNEFNCLKARYSPTEGRLVLFPASQPHSVEPNKSADVRIALSFDIAVTCSKHMDPGRHEFLSPPPAMWDEFQAIDGKS